MCQPVFASRSLSGCLWIDTFPAPIRRESSIRRHLAVWRLDDADEDLRGGAGHAGALDEMVLAQGLGDEDRQASWNEEGNRVALARRLAVIAHRIWLTALSSAGPGKPQQHDNRAGSNAIGGNSSSTQRWNGVPRGTMDEVSSHVRLDLPSNRRQGRGKDCSTSSSNPIMEGPWCRFRREARARERHRHRSGGGKPESA